MTEFYAEQQGSSIEQTLPNFSKSAALSSGLDNKSLSVEGCRSTWSERRNEKCCPGFESCRGGRVGDSVRSSWLPLTFAVGHDDICCQSDVDEGALNRALC